MKKLLLIADPNLPVPPPLYGGVERIIHLIAIGLKERGWAVTLLCSTGSSCPVSRIYYTDKIRKEPSKAAYFSQITTHLITNKYDIVHSFANIDITIYGWLTKRPFIHSFQAMPSRRNRLKARLMSKLGVNFTACGEHMARLLNPQIKTIPIHNGVIVSQYQPIYDIHSDAPLVFLGRIESVKGVHSAIRIAKETSRSLIIAGNLSPSIAAQNYFETEIQPCIDGIQIKYIGTVNDSQKNELLSRASAFLMPIEWEEPFGIVMVEALACGCPVIALNRGAVPEILRDGITGKICENVGEMINAVKSIPNFSRIECRKDAEERFGAEVIANKYADFYVDCLSGEI
jgi:glycosyltransferase involved in cell wall biosynthesis